MTLPATAIAIAGCSGGADGQDSGATTGASAAVTDPTDPSAPATTGPDAAATTTAPTSEAPAPTSAAPAGLPTAFTDVNQTVKDPDLGQTVTVKRIARDLPWPAGYKASAAAYELVAVEMTWTPSTTYTIPITPRDFAVTSGGPTPNLPDTVVDETLKAGGWALLPGEVRTGNAATGWLVFKVDPRGAATLGLDYTRPASDVQGTSADFAAKTFSVKLVG